MWAHARLVSTRDLVVCAYFGLLAFNGLVAGVCLLAGPRYWAQRLCAITTEFNALLLLAWAALLAYIVIDTRWSEEGQLAFSIPFWAFLPILGEFVALLAIYRWRLRAESTA